MKYCLVIKSCVLFITTAVLFALNSCTDNEITAQPPALDKNEMTSLLTDLHTVESAFYVMKKKKPEYNPEYNIQWVLKKYEITEEEFRYAIEYYASDPELLEAIYDEVIIRLTEIQAGKEINVPN